MKQAILDFINSGILTTKPIDAFYTDQFEYFTNECYNRLISFYMKQQSDDKLKSAYIALMKVVQNPKVENLNLLVFCAAYLAQKTYYYQQNLVQMNSKNIERIHLDCYHIITYTLNGVIVSDQYIETNLKKYFTDKYLDYTKKTAPPPQYVKPTKFFGRPVEYTKLESDEGSEFAQTLSGIFKPPTKNRKLPIVEEETQYQVRQQFKSPPIRRMKIDINSISPSLATALHRTSLGFEKPKIINHPLLKSQLGDMNFMQRLKDLEQDGEQKLETKIQRSHRQNIVEQHNLTYPPKEYFQKNVKVDALFKNFLELKYVLDQRKETMSSIKDINDYQPRMPYVPTYTPYLQLESSQPLKQQLIQKSSFETLPPSHELDKATFSKFDIQAQTTKSTFNNQVNSTFFFKTNNKPQSLSKHSTQNSFFQYMNKQKEYKQQFDRFLSNESSPDRNINQINSQLLKKQNFLKKSLQRIKK
ncbi:unnamed protein product (macronuclear) [Paramecium tetraurelia]|uniref:Cyclin N-terminal domain-containing protein n=1 Tax=Paramecium tetraurelia TaxID=5888 RepID=A0DV00_PARTE|nr:uncharacterized protein GSPATT00020529001 [Paramecium tetraurelia]CAK86867.1 unnamed protein product [Paramecium tetraurelia]|eukprot:XP_001454264.1 hypothetical protein (macronuclear) [Paramecium tetraurelia strain d4-2]